MVCWHMGLNGTILSRRSIKALMGRDAVVMIKHLDHIGGKAYLYFLFYIFVRYRVVHLIYRYMIIELHSGCFPICQFIRGSR